VIESDTTQKIAIAHDPFRLAYQNDRREDRLTSLSTAVYEGIDYTGMLMSD
jgi:hypothetical protein